jgi:ribosomal protein S18 acetylase RimI-like enzyme
MSANSPASKPPKYEFEKLTEEDVEFVMEIDRKEFPDRSHKSKVGYTACIKEPDKNGQVYVLRDSRENRIAGYLHLKRESQSTILLCNVARHSMYRGKNVGPFAMCWLRRYATDSNATRIYLHVRASRKRAIELYYDWGFEEVGQRGRYKSGRGADLIKITMELHLPI